MNTLTDDEKLIIKKYTGRPDEKRSKFYEKINNMLRCLTPKVNELLKKSEMISKALLNLN